MDEKLDKIINLIEQSALDRTIKDILIRDLQNDGLTDFLREQIKAYCLEGIKQLDQKMKDAQAVLDAPSEPQATQNPTE